MFFVLHIPSPRPSPAAARERCGEAGGGGGGAELKGTVQLQTSKMFLLEDEKLG
jgi:hypothetical protein